MALCFWSTRRASRIEKYTNRVWHLGFDGRKGLLWNIEKISFSSLSIDLFLSNRLMLISHGLQTEKEALHYERPDDPMPALNTMQQEVRKKKQRWTRHEDIFATFCCQPCVTSLGNVLCSYGPPKISWGVRICCWLIEHLFRNLCPMTKRARVLRQPHITSWHHISHHDVYCSWLRFSKFPFPPSYFLIPSCLIPANASLEVTRNRGGAATTVLFGWLLA